MTVFNKLQRVDVAVKDLDVATADWEQYFGTQAVRLGEDRYSRRVQFGVGDAWIALAEPLSERSPVWQFLHDRGQGVCAAALQAYFGLVDAADHPAPVAKFLKERGEGAYIVSVIDDEPERTVKAIRERGGRVVGDESGRGQLFVHPASTHGVLLEINDEEQTRHWAATYGDPPFDR
jgi:hypothetical protein